MSTVNKKGQHLITDINRLTDFGLGSSRSVERWN